MSHFTDVKDNFSRAWDNVTEGWQHLYQRAKGAITHFDDKSTPPQNTEVKRRNWGLLSTDMVDQDKNLVVTMEIPGLEKGDIEVQLHGDILTVSGHKRIKNQSTQGNYQIMECAYGSFTRSIRLPGTPDESAVDASYENGVLTLTMPKSTQSNKVRINVE